MTPRMEPIRDASVWTGGDLERDLSWRFSLNPGQVADLDSALQQVKNRGLNFGEILREDGVASPNQTVLQRRAEQEDLLAIHADGQTSAVSCPAR